MARVAGQRRPANDRGPAPSQEPDLIAASAEPTMIPVAEPTMIPVAEPTMIVVGRIGRPQGIKGEVTVEVRTDDPEDRFAAGRVLHSDKGPLHVEGSRYQGKFLVVAFEGVHDRNGAELLRDTILSLPVDDLPPLAEEDEYYDTQLIGLTARLTDGTVLGPIADVLHLPHGDVLAVTRDEAPELLIPFVKAIVPVVDLAAGHVVVDPPEGLLDLV